MSPLDGRHQQRREEKLLQPLFLNNDADDAERNTFIGSNTLHTGSSLDLPRMPINFTMHDGAWCINVLEERYTMVVNLLQPKGARKVCTRFTHGAYVSFKGGAWCMDVLEESYTMVVSLLQPEVACEVYSSLRQLLATSETETEDVRVYSSDVRVFTDRVWAVSYTHLTLPTKIGV